MDAFLFYFFALVCVVCAVQVVARGNAIYSALSLIGAMGGLFFIYLMLHAHFLAFIHLMVYAGAVMVLFVFVIQLLDQRDEGAAPLRHRVALLAAVIPIGLIAGALHKVLLFAPTPKSDGMRAGFGTIEQVGRLLVTRYLLPFEVISVLLLAAIVGAVVLAKRRV